MAETINTTLPLSINENYASGHDSYLNLGALVLTDPKWHGAYFWLVSATNNHGNEAYGFSLDFINGEYRIQHRSLKPFDAEQISCVTLQIASSVAGVEIAPLTVLINDINDEVPYFLLRRLPAQVTHSFILQIFSHLIVHQLRICSNLMSIFLRIRLFGKARKGQVKSLLRCFNGIQALLLSLERLKD